MIASDVLESHFSGEDAYVTWSVLTTKRPAGGPTFKGGVSTWPKLERELRLLLRDSSTTVLTTLLDYYAFPAEAPGMADRPHGSPYDRIRHVESALAKAVDDVRFVPHLVLHETETWVLADCRRLGEVMGDLGPAAELDRMVHLESGPELVNDGVDTAPSKRIMRAYPQYAKTIDGPLVIAEAGIDAIRSTCPHADDWFRELEARMLPGASLVASVATGLSVTCEGLSVPPEAPERGVSYIVRDFAHGFQRGAWTLDRPEFIADGADFGGDEFGSTRGTGRPRDKHPDVGEADLEHDRAEALLPCAQPRCLGR
jgi:hypothetical protein